jgi:hypothetical protein
LLFRLNGVSKGRCRLRSDPLDVGLGRHQIRLCPLQVRLRALQFGGRAFEVGPRTLTTCLIGGQVLLRALQFGLRAQQIVLGAFEFALGTFEISQRALPIGVSPLAVALGTHEYRIGSLEIGRGTFSFGVRPFEVRLRARAFRSHGIVQFASQLGVGISGQTLGLGADMLHFFRCTLDLRSGGRELSRQPRVPFTPGLVQFRGPALFRGCLGSAARFLERCRVGAGQTAEMRLQLSLETGSNRFNDRTERILGHWMALCEARSRKSRNENAASSSPPVT